MVNAVRCRRLLHSLPQDEITRLGSEQTAAGAGHAILGGAEVS